MNDEFDIDELINDAESRMKKTLSVFDSELSKIRTGRASTALVDSIKVDYYENPTPINQLANVSVPDPSSIIIQPWDGNVIPEIEKAISQSDLGLTPHNDGKIIRLSIPPLTEERRKELVKYISKIAEEHRIAIRQIRKDVNNKLKDSEKKENIPEDEVKNTLDDIQELTDKNIENLNKIFNRKEKEILEI